MAVATKAEGAALAVRWRAKLGWIAAVLAAAIGSAASGQDPAPRPAPAAPRCAFAAAEDDAVAAVEETGDVVLASGRRARLLDVRWTSLDDTADAAATPQAVSARPGALAWLRTLRAVRVTTLSAGAVDRWNRSPAVLAVPSGGPAAPVDVAELLVAEGLALVDAGERDRLCRPELLAVEASARAARRGVWRDRPHRALDLEGLGRQAGRFTAIEGRVVSVGERRERTYLNFGRDFAKDFAVVLPKRSWAALKEAGHSASSLRGRLVRVRGVVEVRRGPSVEVTAADMVEVLAEGAGRR